MRLERARLQFGMELHTDEPGVVLVFDDFRQHAVGRKTGKSQAMLLETILVGGIDLVAVAVALRDLGGAAIDFRYPAAALERGRVRPEPPGAAGRPGPGALP